MEVDVAMRDDGGMSCTVVVPLGGAGSAAAASASAAGGGVPLVDAAERAAVTVVYRVAPDGRCDLGTSTLSVPPPLRFARALRVPPPAGDVLLGEYVRGVEELVIGGCALAPGRGGGGGGGVFVWVFFYIFVVGSRV